MRVFMQLALLFEGCNSAAIKNINSYCWPCHDPTAYLHRDGNLGACQVRIVFRVVLIRYNHLMNSFLLYQQDPTKLEFDANVTEILTLADGRRGVVLDHSYFYPTSGGQEYDTGAIGSARVVDVFKDEENSRLIHVVEGEVGIGQAHASIDVERRLRHMQHHTAQHLLTQCILRQTGFETVSANINGYSPSTLDIVASQISKSDLDQAEQMANGIIYENRPVKAYFVSPEELQSIPLRRPPKVTENIRIVEIEAFDYSPCGGTHVSSTGSIGILKLLKTEKQNEKQRVYFIAGFQALELFTHMYDVFNSLANRLSMNWQDIPELVNKQNEQLGLFQKELQNLRQLAVKYEARELTDVAEVMVGSRLVRASFMNRPVAELRLLAEELGKLAGMVACLASFDGQKVSLVVACGEGTALDARQLLNRILSPINGRGGGDASLAQGGGVASLDKYQGLLQHIDL
jgi:alanyl-tRNA synthetase